MLTKFDFFDPNLKDIKESSTYWVAAQDRINLEESLDEKNIMAVNTIYFIDDQLAVIQDSLTNIENKIKSFKQQNPNLDLVDKEFGTFFQKQRLDNTLSEQSVNIRYYESLLSYLKDDKNANSIVSPTSTFME